MMDTRRGDTSLLAFSAARNVQLKSRILSGYRLFNFILVGLQCHTMRFNSWLAAHMSTIVKSIILAPDKA